MQRYIQNFVGTHQIPDVEAWVRVGPREAVWEETHPGVVAGKDNLATLVDKLE